jgi:hypothetical protein
MSHQKYFTDTERKAAALLASKKYKEKNEDNIRRARRRYYLKNRKPGPLNNVLNSVDSVHPREKITSSYLVQSLVRLPIEEFAKAVSRIFKGDVIIVNEHKQ